MPVNRFETPEAKGHFGSGEVGLDVSSSQKITLAEVTDPLLNPQTVDPSVKIENHSVLNSKGELGLLSRLDAYAHLNYDGPKTVGLKFQFYGEGEDKLSSGFKAAVSAGYGSYSENNDQTLTTTFAGTTATNKYNTKLDLTATEASLLLGQRIDKSFLLYMNLFGAFYSTKASFVLNGTEKFNTNKKSEQYGALVGIRAGEKSALKIESGFAQAKWGSLKKTIIPLGASLTLGW